MKTPPTESPGLPRLTEPQREELKALAQSRQDTFGKARARVQNTLCRLGFARYVSEGVYDYCEITDAGRSILAPRAASSPDAATAHVGGIRGSTIGDADR